MRTTLDIDADLLNAAKELARRENVSAGQIVSRLLRQSLSAGGRAARAAGEPATSSGGGGAAGVGGFRPFASRGKVVTNEQVNALRDAEGI